MRFQIPEVRMGLSLFQPGNQAITVAFLAKLVVVHAAVLLPHVLLERAQQIACGVVEQFGLGLCRSLRCHFHALNVP